jgi:CelD/BcsL family acetyltransferase involved in cellulose biosynthesis
MTVYSVSPPGDSGALLEEWRGLYERAGEKSFFLSPEWIGAWLAGKPDHVEAFVIRGVDDGKTALLGLVGLGSRRSPPLVGARAAHLHEFGIAALDAVYIENNDFLVAADAPAAARRGAVEAMLDAFAGADDIVFRNIRSPLARAIAEAADTSRRRLVTLNRQPTFSVDLADLAAHGGNYLASLTGSLGAQLRRAQRRYEERGALTFEIASSERARDKAWDDLAALHEEGWRRRGRRGVFSGAGFAAFHRRLIAAAPDKVHLVTICCGGEIIACLYNLVEEGRVLNYQSGFRFEDDNQLKPGFLAHALAIDHYAAHGFSEYDLLAGDAPYKRRLAVERETLQTIVLEKRAGARAGLRRLARALRSAAGKRRT